MPINNPHIRQINLLNNTIEKTTNLPINIIAIKTKNTLLTLYGAKKAKECVINAMQANYAIDSRDITNAESYELSQLFDTSINKMYFSVLKTIIVDNLSAFSYVFEGCSVDMIKNHLNTINISRRCPDHSYTEDAENWTWDDFLKFRESITWLENILKDFE